MKILLWFAVLFFPALVSAEFHKYDSVEMVEDGEYTKDGKFFNAGNAGDRLGVYKQLGSAVFAVWSGNRVSVEASKFKAAVMGISEGDRVAIDRWEFDDGAPSRAEEAAKNEKKETEMEARALMAHADALRDAASQSTAIAKSPQSEGVPSFSVVCSAISTLAIMITLLVVAARIHTTNKLLRSLGGKTQ